MTTRNKKRLKVVAVVALIAGACGLCFAGQAKGMIQKPVYAKIGKKSSIDPIDSNYWHYFRDSSFFPTNIMDKSFLLGERIEDNKFELLSPMHTSITNINKDRFFSDEVPFYSAYFALVDKEIEQTIGLASNGNMSVTEYLFFLNFLQFYYGSPDALDWDRYHALTNLPESITYRNKNFLNYSEESILMLYLKDNPIFSNSCDYVYINVEPYLNISVGDLIVSEDDPNNPTLSSYPSFLDYFDELNEESNLYDYIESIYFAYRDLKPVGINIDLSLRLTAKYSINTNKQMTSNEFWDNILDYNNLNYANINLDLGRILGNNNQANQYDYNGGNPGSSEVRESGIGFTIDLPYRDIISAFKTSGSFSDSITIGGNWSTKLYFDIYGEYNNIGTNYIDSHQVGSGLNLYNKIIDEYSIKELSFDDRIITTGFPSNLSFSVDTYGAVAYQEANFENYSSQDYEAGYHRGYSDGKESFGIEDNIEQVFNGLIGVLNIEIFPNFKLWYVIGIPLLFSILAFALRWFL